MYNNSRYNRWLTDTKSLNCYNWYQNELEMSHVFYDDAKRNQKKQIGARSKTQTKW